MQNADLRLILAAKTSGLPKPLMSTTFLPMPHAEAIGALERAGLWLGPRPTLEQTEAFRQIIPYIVLSHSDGFIRYTRTTSGGEERLYGRTSVGLGGHVDLADVETAGGAIDLAKTLERAAARELAEELGCVDIVAKEWVGLLVECDTAVGRVHIGMVGLWQLRSLPTGMSEDAIGDVGLASARELRESADRLESWSAMLLPWLGERFVEP